MSLKLGNSEISKVFLGSGEVSKMYLGSNLVYENQKPFKYWLAGYYGGSNETIGVSTDYGNTFASKTILPTSTDTKTVAMSNNGKYMYDCSNISYYNKFMRSDDYGNTWTISLLSDGTELKNKFSGVACSKDGKYVIAVSYKDPTFLYKSIDYGVTFLKMSGVTRLGGIAVSDTGQYMVAAPAASTSYIIYSEDYGETWMNSNTKDGNANARLVMSGNGQYVFYYTYKGTGVRMSSDYGQTWSSVIIYAHPVLGFALSYTGQYGYHILNNTSFNIRKTINYAGHWAATTQVTPTTESAIFCSDDGSEVIAVANNSMVRRYSSDYGETWSNKNSTTTNVRPLNLVVSK